MTAHYLLCSHIKIYLYTRGHNLIAHLHNNYGYFIGLFGAIEEAQNSLRCKNGLGDRQVGKLTTATSHTLVTFLLWPVSLSTSLFGRYIKGAVGCPVPLCVVSW